MSTFPFALELTMDHATLSTLSRDTLIQAMFVMLKKAHETNRNVCEAYNAVRVTNNELIEHINNMNNMNVKFTELAQMMQQNAETTRMCSIALCAMSEYIGFSEPMTADMARHLARMAVGHLNAYAATQPVPVSPAAPVEGQAMGRDAITGQWYQSGTVGESPPAAADPSAAGTGEPARSSTDSDMPGLVENSASTDSA